MKLIEEYYNESKLPKEIIPRVLSGFERNPDIAEEFEYYLEHKAFKKNNPVTIEGYTAEKLSEMSVYMKGGSLFNFMVQLREQPKTAQAIIKSGFKVK